MGTAEIERMGEAGDVAIRWHSSGWSRIWQAAGAASEAGTILVGGDGIDEGSEACKGSAEKIRDDILRREIEVHPWREKRASVTILTEGLVRRIETDRRFFFVVSFFVLLLAVMVGEFFAHGGLP